MKRKSRGQTLVEFAMVFPLIMALIFGVMDFGYWIYAWSQIQYSARRGAEQASIMQPRDAVVATSYHSILNDPCLDRIVEATKGNGAFSTVLATKTGDIFITWYTSAADGAPKTGNGLKKLGNVIQVTVDRTKTDNPIVPLTPLAQTFVSQYKFIATSRRTIVSTGPNYPYVDGKKNYNTCTTAP